ncbi:MAG: PD-(D/E)XK nuclease family protein, partial [Paucibacter sp.]|nr:PD-(D/E)XK nuclease family protein [Roseateles sp.]
SVYLSDRDSVYASPEAHDLWRVLRAVAFPRASAWVKAALATSLWGLDWPALDALLHEEAAWEAVVDRFHAWQQVWERQGFLPMLHQLLHDEGIPARLLGLDVRGEPLGERRLTNLLHLGDLLQAASLGLQGQGSLIRHLELQLQNPQASGDAAQTRLESDAELVQIVTMHKSKGLQYPLVFLPFASGYRASDEDDEQRLAEDLRLLYVALTRAERAMWLGVAPVHGDLDGKSPKLKSALSLLLDRRSPDDLPDALARWQACAAIEVSPAPVPDSAPYIDRRRPASRKSALQPRRAAYSRWWTASFSALARELHEVSDALPSERDERLGDAQIDSQDLGEEALSAAQQDLLASPWNAFPAGSRYGSLLHDLLEWQAQQGWPAAQDKLQPDPAWTLLLARKRAALQLDEAQVRMLDAWVTRLACAELRWTESGSAPGYALVLGRMRRSQAWAEMGFSLPGQGLAVETLDRLMQRHLLPGQAREALQPRRLEGMLTGFMDLVFQHQGRYYVLDYKSNRLPAYAPDQLRQAVLAHRYEVQYSLYLLALHRLLKSRLPDYAPEQHLGGAVYWFVRGVDEPGQGLYVDQPDVALIEALDALFAGASS